MATETNARRGAGGWFARKEEPGESPAAGTATEGSDNMVTVVVRYYDPIMAAECKAECELCPDPIRKGDLFVEIRTREPEEHEVGFIDGFAHFDCARGQ